MGSNPEPGDENEVVGTDHNTRHQTCPCFRLCLGLMARDHGRLRLTRLQPNLSGREALLYWMVMEQPIESRQQL